MEYSQASQAKRGKQSGKLGLPNGPRSRHPLRYTSLNLKPR